MQRCDNKSVGVIIIDESGEYLLLERARFPYGLAPPAGHVDNHGDNLNAALVEAYEELGLKLEDLQLESVVEGRTTYNTCRRSGGSHHEWQVYIARVERALCQLRPSIEETNGAGWYSAREVRELADKTLSLGRAVQKGDMPALEPVWADFFADLNLIPS